MPLRATQDGWVIAESSDRMWSTGGQNGKPLQYSCLENPMNSIKRENLTSFKMVAAVAATDNEKIHSCGLKIPRFKDFLPSVFYGCQGLMWLLLAVMGELCRPLLGWKAHTS